MWPDGAVTGASPHSCGEETDAETLCQKSEVAIIVPQTSYVQQAMEVREFRLKRELRDTVGLAASPGRNNQPIPIPIPLSQDK
jgi:hypothetical protein